MKDVGSSNCRIEPKIPSLQNFGIKFLKLKIFSAKRYHRLNKFENFVLVLKIGNQKFFLINIEFPTFVNLSHNFFDPLVIFNKFQSSVTFS